MCCEQYYLLIQIQVFPWRSFSVFLFAFCDHMGAIDLLLHCGVVYRSCFAVIPACVCEKSCNFFNCALFYVF